MKTLENLGAVETVGQWSVTRVPWQGLWLRVLDAWSGACFLSSLPFA